MNNQQFIKEEINKMVGTSNLDERKKATINKNNIVFIVAGIIIIALIAILQITQTSEDPGDYYNLLKNVSEVYSSKSYRIDEKIILYNDDNNDGEYQSTYSITNEIIKKDDNYKIKSSINDGENDIDAGGIFFNKDRIEFLIDENDSVFVKYEDIYNVIKTYLPDLNELCDDLSKINYLRYENEINKLTSQYFKSFDLSSYYKLINDKIIDLVRKEECDDSYTKDGKEYNLERYYAEVSTRDMIEIKLEMLNKFKNDTAIRKYIKELNDVLLENFEKTKDYENIRMTKDEFSTFKLKYSNELITLYDEIINKKIDELEKLYSKVSSSQIDCYSLYFNEDGEVKKLETYSAELINNEVTFIKIIRTFSKVNEIKSKEIVPSNNVRLNLALLNRSDLYTSIEAVKEKLNDVKNKMNDSMRNYVETYFNVLNKE